MIRKMVALLKQDIDIERFTKGEKVKFPFVQQHNFLMSLSDLKNAIIIASSEAYMTRNGVFAPTISGGLGAFTTSLAKSLTMDYGEKAVLMIPGHGGLFRSLIDMGQPIFNLSESLRNIMINDGHANYKLVLRGTTLPDSDTPVLIVNSVKGDDLFNKEIGKLYGYGYRFDGFRFMQFDKAVAKFAGTINSSMVHANDWQAGYIPMLLKKMYGFNNIPTLGTIHNLQYSNRMEGDEFFRQTGLYDQNLYNAMHPMGVVHQGEADPLKTLINWSDLVNTVSQVYAEETANDPAVGYEFTGLLGHKLAQGKYLGRVNGGNDEYNPEIDRYIKHPYSREDVRTEKPLNKAHVQNVLGFGADESKFLITLKSRFSDQKGYDVLYKILPELLRTNPNIQMYIMAEANFSDQKSIDLRARFEELAAHFPNQLKLGKFDREMESYIFAGSDLIMMPSKFEPCGMVQLHSFKYGTPVLGSDVGGLKETIKHNKNGFLFYKENPGSLYDMVWHAYNTWQNEDAWWEIVDNAMAEDYSNKRMAGEYLKLYEQARQISNGNR